MLRLGYSRTTASCTLGYTARKTRRTQNYLPVPMDNWCQRWGMQLNPAKTVFVRITSKRRNIHIRFLKWEEKSGILVWENKNFRCPASSRSLRGWLLLWQRLRQNDWPIGELSMIGARGFWIPTNVGGLSGNACLGIVSCGVMSTKAMKYWFM